MNSAPANFFHGMSEQGGAIILEFSLCQCHCWSVPFDRDAPIMPKACHGMSLSLGLDNLSAY